MLPQESRDLILRQAKPTTLVRGVTVAQLDTVPEDVYFIDEGLVSLVKTLSDGKTVEVGAIGPEGVVGVEGLWAGNPTYLESVVQIPGRAHRVSVEVLRREVFSNEAVQTLLQKYVHGLVAQVAQTAACNRLHSLQQRCCRWLLIAQDCASDDTFPLTHEFLAMMLGVRRTAVTLMASELQKSGLIQYVRGRVTIIDRAGLEELSCECYSAVNRLFDDLFSRGVAPPKRD